jgi:cytoskeletal protein CcmA (bactofilin family)
MKFGNRPPETSKPRSGDVNGFFGEGIEIRGDLRFKDTVRVDGRVAATIRSEGELVLGPSGVIEGEVTVGSLIVSGRIKGKMVLGRPGLVVHDGGVVEAQIQMGTVKQTATADAVDHAQQQQERLQRKTAVATGAV